MSTTLPPCSCGGTSYYSNGSSSSSALHQAWHTCNDCGAQLLEVEGGSGAICILTPNGVSQKPVVDWINRVMLPTWRYRQSLITAHQRMEWRRWLAEVFYPAFPDLQGMRTVLSDGTLGETIAFDDERITYYQCPAGAQALYCSYFGGPSVVQKFGTYIPLPKELEEPIIPPQFPRDIEATLWMMSSPDGDWIRVSQEMSWAQVLPPDPIVVEDNEFFDKVWEDMAAAGVHLPSRSPVPNQYGGVAPWHTFTVNGTTFTVGRRRRVISLQVESPTPFPTVRLSRVARRDGVTYKATLPLQRVSPEDFPATKQEGMLLSRMASKDGLVEYEPKGYPRATKVTIHAWNRDKLVEYLLILMGAIKA